MSKALLARLPKTACIILVMVALACPLSGQDISCDNAYEICSQRGDIWYGFVLIDAFGRYNGDPSASKAFNIRNDEVLTGGVSAASCFLREVEVFNDGTYRCRIPGSGNWETNCESLGSSDICPGGKAICLTDRDDAFSGRYTVLGEPSKRFPKSIDPSIVNPQQELETKGRYVVVKNDWTIIGVDEENYVRRMWYEEHKGSTKDYESTLWSVKYILARACDIIGAMNDTRICKRGVIFDKGWRKMEAVTQDSVYSKAIESLDFEPCLWSMIDYGKFYRNPGVMLVLLNRSKFGAQRGFMFNAIVDQEVQFINHVYPQSFFSGNYPGRVIEYECCKVMTGGTWDYSCVPAGSCIENPNEGVCIWSSEPVGGCLRVACSNCHDCTCGPNSYEVKKSVYNWNRDAAERLFGCDACTPGSVTCSMGSALANYIDYLGVRNVYPTTPWPPAFDEAPKTCGYYRPWNMDHWVRTGTLSDDCNCLTGLRGDRDPGVTPSGIWMCDKAECEECGRRGYGCQWETGGTNGCFNCYDPTPNGRPDEQLIKNSTKSVYTIINATHTDDSWYDGSSFACGHNEGNGYEWKVPWLLGPTGEYNEGCSNAYGNPVGCAINDCMLPWNTSAESVYPNNLDLPKRRWDAGGGNRGSPNRVGWDLINRGGGVLFEINHDSWTLTYLNYITNYLTNVNPYNCSDWSGTAVPWFWGDRYSECTFSALSNNPTFKCNCTRPEHIPKNHTPCACPGEGGADAALPLKITSCPNRLCWFYGDGSYFRLFNRDTLWAKVFKITPEVANVTIKPCSNKVNCSGTYNNLKESLEDMEDFSDIKAQENLCNKRASPLICDGCYFNLKEEKCKNCVDKDNTVNITKCRDYSTNDSCNENGCGIAGGCFWVGYGDNSFCTHCPSKTAAHACSVYATISQCTQDPCGFGDCGWDKVKDICKPKSWGDKTCAEMCGADGSGCSKGECRMVSPVTKDRCTYDTAVIGSPGAVNKNCVSCALPHIKGAKCLTYMTKESCEDDLCGFSCYWWNPGGENQAQCRTCSATMSEGCGMYASSDECNKNKCGVEGGCAMGETENCTSCASIDSCERYGKESCYKNPCNIGDGCGWDALGGTCKRAGSVKADCLYMGPGPTIPPPNIKECLTDVSTIIQGGCWGVKLGALWSQTFICANCDGSGGYPVRSCYDYSSEFKGFLLKTDGKGGCMRDDCNVGPCVWITDAIGERCVPALTEIPGEGLGWIRSGGITGDTGENIGGGNFFVHAGGGMNIPNQSEAEGFSYDEMAYRNGSIWSEAKEYDTLHVLNDYGQKEVEHKRATDNQMILPKWGWDNLMACDKETIRCGVWTNIKKADLVDVSPTPWNVYWSSMRKRIPMDSSTRPSPPSVCGTLCAKKVIKWPQYDRGIRDTTLDREGSPTRYWEKLHGGFINITVNETVVGGGRSRSTLESVATRSPLYYLKKDDNGNVLNKDKGNILPPPSHPYTELNWFNMPTSGDWMLQDDTANISIEGNYTFNATLTRVPLAMQCLWDGCLFHSGYLAVQQSGDKKYARYLYDRYHCSEETEAPCRNYGECQRNIDAMTDEIVDPNSCQFSWQDAHWKCERYTKYIHHYRRVGRKLIPVYYCICADRESYDNGTQYWSSNRVWQFRCISCWTHDRCDYPLLDENGTQFLEEFNDSSSVVTDRYGEKLSVERPLSGPNPTDNLTINVSGYIDAYGEHKILGYIKIKAEPDILNGFNIIFPKNFIMEYTAKNYPVEHELYRTQRTMEKDECIHSGISGFPGDDSRVWCPMANGRLDYLTCGKYPAYKNLKPSGEKEYDSQLVWCVDSQTKKAYSAIKPFRQPQNAFLQITNNPLKKYYHYNDRFMALDKNYSMDMPIYGIDAGVFSFDWVWVDPSLSMGVLRNYHEDEENYYDLAALYPQPRPTERDYATLYRNYTVTAIYGTKLNKYVNVDGFVKYDSKNGVYYINFNSDTMNASVLEKSTIRFFTHYRSIDKPLMGGVGGSPAAKKVLANGGELESDMILGAGGGSDLVLNTVGERRRTNLILNVEGIPKAFQDVTISVMVDPYPTGDPKALVYVSIADPYNEYHVIQHGGFFTLKLKNSKAVVKASYPGYWNDETNEGYMSESAEVVISPEYTMNPLIQTKVFLLLIIAFAVIVSYRFFMSKRMDYYTMFQESGLEEMFKDFFGFK